MNQKLARIIKSAKKNRLGGPEIVEIALRAKIPITDVIRGVGRRYALYWGIWVDGRSKKGHVRSGDLVGYVNRAWKKKKSVCVSIWFSYHRTFDETAQPVPDKYLDVALKREVQALKGQRRKRVRPQR